MRGLTGQGGGQALRAALWLAVAAAFLAFTPGNHSEAEDAFDYAWRVERAPATSLLHPHHLLYEPLGRIAWRAVSAFDPARRAFPVLVALSKAAALLGLTLFHRILVRRVGLGAGTADAFTLLLAFSYGYWRYAAEAEVYAPAAAAALGLCLAAMSPRTGLRHGAATGLLAALAILAHAANFTLACVAVPVGLLLQRRVRDLAVYTAVAAAILLAAYGAAFGPRLRGPSERDGAAPAERGVSGTNLARGVVALGQDVVSGNFLFAWPGAADRLERLFPHRQLQEELFAGRHADRLGRVAPLVTLPLLLAAFAWTLAAGLRRPAADLRSPVSGPRPPPAPASGLPPTSFRFFLLPAWFVSYAAFILWFEPGNPEMWVLGLAPLWLCTAVWFARGDTARFPEGLAAGRDGPVPVNSPRGSFGTAAPWLLALALLAHNGLAGMRLIASPDADYNARKAAWVIGEAREGDLVLTWDNQVFSRYLRYHAKARVENLFTAGDTRLASLRDELASGTNRVFAMSDVFAPPPYLRRLQPGRYPALRAFGESVQPLFRNVRDDEFGGVWTVSAPPKSPAMRQP